MTNDFELKGLDEVADAISKLPHDLQVKIIYSFLSKAGKKFIVNNLKSALPYSAKTKSHIRISRDKKAKTEVALYAGVDGDSYWVRWTDLGTKQRQTKKGANRGSIVGKQQIRGVHDAQIKPIIDYTNEELGKEIEKNLLRRIKRTTKK
jgi:hypothetical protein